MKRLVSSLSAFIFLLFFVACQSETEVEHLLGREEILEQITEPVIPSNVVYLSDFGGRGDSLSDNKAAFDAAIKKLKEAGGGRLVVSSGTYLVNGPIHLVSNMDLHLEKGATIRFSSVPEHYLPVVETSWEGTFLYNYSPFIYAKQCSNLMISGEGVIDGEGAAPWSDWKAKQQSDQQLSRDMNHQGVPLEKRIFGEGHFLRPHLIQFFDCEQVMVEGVRIEDSPFWCVHLLRCENVIVRGISFNAHNKNNDGIDPEYSRNVLIEDVQFNNSDDNVAIKAGRDDEGRSSKHGSENIIVRNCHFKGLHAFVIGSEMSAGVQNVHVYDCDFAGDLKRGIYLKSNPDRGGFIRNVFVSNLRFGKVEDAIYITSYYHNEGEGHQTEIANIHFENLSFMEATGTGIVLQGFPDKKLSNIYLRNVNIKSAANALTMTDTENITMSNVLIGEPATVPSAVH
ncbi:glycoside hydrolase family 28 protein [Roseimarinus sediminis]|uniref:glycoside hydrolase family 28 protein n=1 Tax=Roseimarinus sediminis TaxID=1610899 RepID=UPI003D1F32A7